MSECTCWHKYPNPLCKERCLEQFEVVRDMGKGRAGRYYKTKCRKKEVDERVKQHTDKGVRNR